MNQQNFAVTCIRIMVH